MGTVAAEWSFAYKYEYIYILNWSHRVKKTMVTNTHASSTLRYFIHVHIVYVGRVGYTCARCSHTGQLMHACLQQLLHILSTFFHWNTAIYGQPIYFDVHNMQNLYTETCNNRSTQYSYRICIIFPAKVVEYRPYKAGLKIFLLSLLDSSFLVIDSLSGLFSGEIELAI